jgi:hypothetical protein
VVIHNLNIKHITVTPPKTQPPLIVYTNAVLSCPIAFQGFQPITGRASQKLQAGGIV